MTSSSAAKFVVPVVTVFAVAAGLLFLFPDLFPGRGIESTVAWRVRAAAGGETDLDRYAQAARSDQVLTRALGRMGIEDASPERLARLRDRVEVTTDSAAPHGPVLRLHTYGGSFRSTRTRAEAVAGALEAWDLQRLEARVEELDQQVRILQVTATPEAEAAIEELMAERNESSAAASQAEGALARDGITARQISPWTVRNAVFVSLFAGVFSATTLLGREPRRRPPQRSGRNSRRANANVRVVGSIPYAGSGGRPGPSDSVAPVARSFLKEVRRLPASRSPSVLITSASGEEGKSTVATLLAEELAQMGHKILLVDCNLGAPALARHYAIHGIPSVEGHGTPTTLAWLRRPARAGPFVRVALDGDCSIDLVPQFRPDLIARGVASALFRKFPSALRRREAYDLVLVDAAPFVPDGQQVLSMARHVDGVLLVADRHRTRRTRLMKVGEAVGALGCDVLGVVVNDTLGARGPTASGAAAPPHDGREAAIVDATVTVRELD